MTAYDFRRVIKTVFISWTTVFIVLQESVAQTHGTVSDPSPDTSYFFYQQSEYPRDCKEVQDQCPSNNSSGVYYIKPDGYPDPFEVYCDIAGDSTGWTVIHRRVINGIVRFDRDWNSYKTGFGFPSHEFWIGNERLAYLTNQEDYALRIQMTLTGGSRFEVIVNKFRIGDEFSGYKLSSLNEYTSSGDHVLTWCQSNMVYGNCTCGQRRCQDPSTCVDTCAEDHTEGCICPDGYHMERGECVEELGCGCYFSEEQTVVLEGKTYINSDCSREAICSDGRLTLNRIECSSDAVCDEREDGRRCYCNDGFEGDGKECRSTTLPVDCMDIYNGVSTNSGVYSIKPTNWAGSPFDVYCNMTNGGGWTVLQKRFDGSVDFYLDWDDYRSGFGDKNGEHWLGNDMIHSLTNQNRYKVRIDVVNRDHDQYYAEFDFFRIENEDALYVMSGLGAYTGNADERSNPNGYYILGRSRDQPFSTKDSDNDDLSSYDLAESSESGWWFSTWYDRSGYFHNINGDYSNSFRIYYLPGDNYLYSSEMKIRPV